MSTFVQLLRLSFWMLPLQRWLTLLGAVVLLGGLLFHPPVNAPGSTLPITFLGVGMMALVPMFAGGVFLRMLSTSRALLLRPHARGRLLAGAVGILLLVSSVWIFAYWAAFQQVPAKFRPALEEYSLMLAMTLSFGTLCAVALFIASRSPVWTLLIILIWQAPGLLLHVLGVEDASRLLGGPVSFAMSLLLWLAFGTWYLRARRIHASAWGHRQEAAPAIATASVRQPATREQAMSRWLLANQSAPQLGLYCLLAALAVLGIQWIFAREVEAQTLHAIMFGTLAIVAVVTGAVGRAMAARSRALWLPAGRTRLQLYGWIERQSLLVTLAIGVAVGLVATLAWWLSSPRPAMPLAYLLPALLVPGLCSVWLGIMQQHRRSLLDVLAMMAIAAGIFYGLVRPLFIGSAAARWDLLAAQLVLAVLLREMAWLRWRSADWRRAQRA
jgi:hypothetical protein